MKEIIIKDIEANQTVFKYVKKYLKEAPLGFIEKLFRKKDVKINSHWVDKSYLLKSNDILRIYIKDEQLEEFKNKKVYVPTTFTSKIIYEDDNLLILNKEKGILVHEDKNEKVRTLANQVISYLINKGEYSPLFVNAFTPAPCHRLDRNTSGLIVFAKNMDSLQIMEELFKNKDELDKYYLALVVGEVKEAGVVNAPLKKDASSNLVKIDANGKTAITEYKIKRNYKDYTLLDIHLITGRTHQIRVHMASINHPVIGDAKYGNFNLNHEFRNKYHYENQFLHAYKLEFHNIKGKLSYLSNKTFTSNLNEKEETILKSL